MALQDEREYAATVGRITSPGKLLLSPARESVSIELQRQAAYATAVRAAAADAYVPVGVTVSAARPGESRVVLPDLGDSGSRREQQGAVIEAAPVTTYDIGEQSNMQIPQIIVGAAEQVAGAYLQREVNRILGPQPANFGGPVPPMSYPEYQGGGYLPVDTSGPGIAPIVGEAMLPARPINPRTGKPYKSVLYDPATNTWKRCYRRRRKLLTDADFNALLKIQTLKNTDNVKIALAKAVR